MFVVQNPHRKHIDMPHRLPPTENRHADIAVQFCDLAAPRRNLFPRRLYVDRQSTTLRSDTLKTLPPAASTPSAQLAVVDNSSLRGESAVDGTGSVAPGVPITDLIAQARGLALVAASDMTPVIPAALDAAIDRSSVKNATRKAA